MNYRADKGTLLPVRYLFPDFGLDKGLNEMDTRGNKRIVRFIPNALTLGRLFLTEIFLAMILYASQTDKDKLSGFLLTAFILFVVTGVTDIVDGKIARMFNVTSKFGRMTDPLADKFLVCGAFICFAIAGHAA